MRPGSSDTQPPRFELVEIAKRFGSFVANEKVSLKLEPGTFHALLGENGAGKSTLVECIMDIIWQTPVISSSVKASDRFAARTTLISS